jgi:uncharacterized membrane protein YeaQ/YmgE (transglycosylase-associated protein family)
MEPLTAEDIRQLVNEWFNVGLDWVGFGTIVGLSAKAIMPGKDPGGALATVVFGLVGLLLGSGSLSYIADYKVDPISLEGFGLGTVGAFVLLLIYRTVKPAKKVSLGDIKIKEE